MPDVENFAEMFEREGKWKYFGKQIYNFLNERTFQEIVIWHLGFQDSSAFSIEITNHIPLSSIGYFSLGFVLYRESCIIYQSHKSENTQYQAYLNVRDNYFLCSSS
jgi:hypothetical protein